MNSAVRIAQVLGWTIGTGGGAVTRVCPLPYFLLFNYTNPLCMFHFKRLCSTRTLHFQVGELAEFCELLTIVVALLKRIKSYTRTEHSIISTAALSITSTFVGVKPVAFLLFV